MIHILVVTVAYFMVGAFYAGASRIHGELKWISVMQGEYKEEYPAPRSHYLVIVPMRWFFLWPLGKWLAARAIEREERRRM